MADVADDWFRLDNAAKIYPSSHSETSPEVFRVSMTLTRPIRVSALEAALERMMIRCPYYQVQLGRGLFWYFLQRHQGIPRIQPLTSSPISSLSIRGQHLLRVQARETTIAIDFSHILTDGYGGMRFLSSLVAEYLRICGEFIPDSQFLLSPGEPADPAEIEDSYRKAFRKGTPKPPSLQGAYHLPGLPRISSYRTIVGSVDLSEALALAKSHGATLTEYLSAVYLHALTRIYNRQVEGVLKPRRSIIRLEVPVNMRRFHDSETMRNFSLFVSPELDMRLGGYAFEDILAHVHHSLKMQLAPRELDRQIARNVGGEMNPLVRIVPLFIKDLYLSFLHYHLGDSLYTGVLSNLGRFQMPEVMEPFVSDVGFNLGPNPVIKKNCSVVSHRGRLTITFGSVLTSRFVERYFFTHLAEQGLHVRLTEKGG